MLKWRIYGENAANGFLKDGRLSASAMGIRFFAEKNGIEETNWNKQG
jgi:hypothetical protein